LKDKSNTLVRALTILFNEVLNSGNFPNQWKTDKRIPLYKSGGKTVVSNYRLIAIHSVFRKIFCTILHERIRSFIKLDDAQNGFRENRRGSDNALILNNVIQQCTRGNGAYIIVIDFSKAFDRCHISTLLRKMARKNIKGKMLRIIQSMYTGAEAQMYINGKLGSPFEVTRGVAQGCVLSPTFFDIYIDDLLQCFREAGLGVPVGQFIQGPLSFADDLALIAPDLQGAKKYLALLETWCQENFFQINVKKSGLLRIGKFREERKHKTTATE